MKKSIILFAAALSVLAGCTPEGQTTVSQDKISIAPDSKIVDGKGGDVKVMVTSSGDWTLAASEGQTYDWVSADKTAGADGDIVVFDVKPNNETEKTANFVFSCGQATAPLTIVSKPGEIPVITITSESAVQVSYEAGKFSILVGLKKLSKEDLVVEVSDSWVQKLFIGEGETENSAKIDMSYEKLDDLEGREATVTISGTDANPVTVTVSQSPKSVLSVSPGSESLNPAEGGTFAVTVTANVEYGITYGEGSDWLTDHVTEGNVEKWNYTAYTEEGKQRTATIIFTETNPAEGAEPLTATVSVKQSNLKYVLNLDNARIDSPEEWANPDVLKLGKNLSVEMLIKHPGLFNSHIGCIFGVERRFLIRHGDYYPYDGWELVAALNSQNSQNEYNEWKVQIGSYSNPGIKLLSGQWMHIAVTLDGTTAVLYLNGEVAGSGTLPSNFRDVDFTESYVANRTTQRFRFGWGYEDGRDWEGNVAEARIWNRALSQDEIKAEGHYFSVPADSEGLVAYWKMLEGDGSVIYDSTSNGNHLTAQTKPNGYTWEPGANWEEVDVWPPVIE